MVKNKKKCNVEVVVKNVWRLFQRRVWTEVLKKGLEKGFGGGFEGASEGDFEQGVEGDVEWFVWGFAGVGSVFFDNVHVDLLNVFGALLFRNPSETQSGSPFEASSETCPEPAAGN